MHPVDHQRDQVQVIEPAGHQLSQGGLGRGHEPARHRRLRRRGGRAPPPPARRAPARARSGATTARPASSPSPACRGSRWRRTPVAALRRAAQLDAVGAGLFLIPASADAQFEPPARHYVEGSGRVRQDRGMPVVNAGDQRAQPQPAGRLRERGQGHPALQAGARRIGEDRIEVVEDPARLEQVNVVSFLPHREHVAPGGVLRGGFECESHTAHPGKAVRVPVHLPEWASHDHLAQPRRCRHRTLLGGRRFP